MELKGGISKRISVISYDAFQCYRDLSREQKEYIWTLCSACPSPSVALAYGHPYFLWNVQYKWSVFTKTRGLIRSNIHRQVLYLCYVFLCVCSRTSLISFIFLPISFASLKVPYIKTPVPSTHTHWPCCFCFCAALLVSAVIAQCAKSPQWVAWCFVERPQWFY